MRGAAILVVCGSLLLASPALAERARVRLGDHPGHGRIVLDLAAPDIPYWVEEGPDGALLRLGPDFEAELPSTRRFPRNVLGLEQASEGLRVVIRPGSRLRHFRLRNM
ncbi:MAG TPA: hypothetical protein VIL69_00620, partial [Roseomonas sp.]